MGKQHTPTPWQVDSGCPTDIRDANGALVLFISGDDETCEGDAALIVLAVNHHDALVEALEDIASSDDVDNALDPERNKRVARAALAAVRGQNSKDTHHA